jgi:predicted nucleotidyltransferase
MGNLPMPPAAPPDDPLAAVARLAREAPGLRLLLLYGSRARGDDHPASDWDLGYLAAPGFDADDFLARLVLGLETERIDLVDLARAGALLRFRAAGDGKVLFEREKGAFERFWFEAVSFWCDVQPIVEREYGAILTRLRA